VSLVSLVAWLIVREGPGLMLVELSAVEQRYQAVTLPARVRGRSLQPYGAQYGNTTI
jgi:hypothetical protein